MIFKSQSLCASLLNLRHQVRQICLFCRIAQKIRSLYQEKVRYHIFINICSQILDDQCSGLVIVKSEMYWFLFNFWYGILNDLLKLFYKIKKVRFPSIMCLIGIWSNWWLPELLFRNIFMRWNLTGFSFKRHLYVYRAVVRMKETLYFLWIFKCYRS